MSIKFAWISTPGILSSTGVGLISFKPVADVPRIPSYKVTDLAKAIGPSHKQKIVGIRSGEKIHEVMISNADSYYTIDLGDYFVITSRDAQKLRDHYISNFSGKLFPEGEEYDSGSNEKFLSVDELKKLIL